MSFDFKRPGSPSLSPAERPHEDMYCTVSKNTHVIKGTGVEREGMWLSKGETEDDRKRIYENMVHRVGDMSEFRNRLLSKVGEAIRTRADGTNMDR